MLKVKTSPSTLAYLLNTFYGLKSKTSLLLAITLLAILVACKKNEHEPTIEKMRVSGYAIDLVSKDSVAGAKVVLKTNMISSGGSQIKDMLTVVDSTTTDSRGYFTLDFECVSNDENGRETLYGLYAEKDRYYKSPSLTIHHFTCRTAGQMDFKPYLQPLNWLRVNIKNTMNPQPSDSIFYDGPLDYAAQHRSNPYYSYAHIFGLQGANIDTTFLITLKGDDSYVHIWDVYKSGGGVRNAAFTACPPHDTCELNIEY